MDSLLTDVAEVEVAAFANDWPLGEDEARLELSNRLGRP